MKNSVSVSYKTVVLAAFICVVSIGAMELPTRDDLVTSTEMKDLTQSIMMAAEEEVSSSTSLYGWLFSATAWSDWWNGLDTNVVSQLNQGTLTKDMVAQDKVLQQRAYAAVDTAIAKNRTENLCDLLKQLNKFDMLVLDENQHEAITLFLNKEIVVACQQKVSAKLIMIINAMKNAELSINNDLLNDIHVVFEDQKQSDIQIFKNKLESTQAAVLKLQEQMLQDKELYKGPLLQAQEILLLQKYLVGQDVPNAKQVKKELGIDGEADDLNNLLRAIKKFVDKK